MRRVVVTGLGALSPIGNNLEEFAQAIKEGKSGCSAITRFDASLFKTRFACEVKNYNAAELLDKRAARRMDLFSQFGMVVSDEAIQHSGLDIDKLNLDRVGVIWGSGIVGNFCF